ncbi:MAG: DUF7715 family protein, partial [Actinomycetota bacterium]
DNDFCWTVEGELVFLAPLQCEPGSVDDECGCRRAMAGMVSHHATTTIRVAHRDELNPDLYFKLVSEALRDQGYVPEESMTKPDVDEWLHDLTDELIFLGRTFEAGTVLERRGDFIGVRRRGGRIKADTGTGG